MDKEIIVGIITADGESHDASNSRNANDRLYHEVAVFVARLAHQYNLSNSQGKYLATTIIHFLFPTLLSSKYLDQKIRDLATLVKEQYPSNNDE